VLSPGLREVYDGFISGKDVSASQKKVGEQRRILEKYQPYPPLLKAVLSRLFDQPRWPVRLPLVEISKGSEKQIMEEFSA